MNDCKEYQSQEKATQKKVEFYIQLGSSMLEMGNEDQAERAYRTAVKIAKREAGEDSGVAGCALAELWFFYDSLEREEEAELARQQLIELIRARYVEVIDQKFD